MFQTIAPLVIFLFPLAFSPGPGNMFFAAIGARFGFAATLPANAGYHVATWIVTAAIGFGFVAAMDQFPQVFVILKAAGSVYVLWLAWRLFKAGTVDGVQEANPARFRDGVILLVLNPKAYVIIALMFSQFLIDATEGQMATILLITTVFTLNNLVAFTLWTVVGDTITGFFRTPDGARVLNRLFGSVLAMVAVWMLIA